MNRKLLTGIFSVILVGGAFWLTNNHEAAEATYVPRQDQGVTAHNAGYFEYLQSVRANVETGKVETSDLLRGYEQAKKFSQANSAKAVNMTWNDRGPDNIGGRTRAIEVIASSPNKVFAGSVNGGLWYSSVEGNWWQQVTGFTENLTVSSIAQTSNGRLFVATGSTFDGPSGQEGSGSAGKGIWYTDEIDVNASFTLLPNSEPTGVYNFSSSKAIWNRIAADGLVADKLWAGGNDGLYMYTDAGGFVEIPGFNQIADIAVQKHPSQNTEVIVVAEFGGGGIVTYVSTDGGTTFNQVSTSNGANSTIPSGGVARATYAISPDDPNWIYCAQANNAAALKGVFHSMDGGTTWDEIAGPAVIPAPGVPAPFDPFTGGNPNGQGYYDNCITVVPGQKDRILVGGVQMWEWEQVTTSPSFGQWEQAAFQGSTCQLCVHSDLHWFEWDPNGVLYIGCDGGVYKSPDASFTQFYPANRGYNVTQFYAIDYSKHDAIVGGTQDNGTLYVNGSGQTWQEAAQIRGGDGFGCEISYINPEVIFSSVYNGDIARSNAEGSTGWDYFYSTPLQNTFDAGGLGDFFTEMALWENPNDPTSRDSVVVTLNGDVPIGDTVFYSSTSVQEPLFHIATTNLDSGDVITLVDRVQSLFAAGWQTSDVNLSGVWVTRDALRFAQEATWIRVLTGAQINNANPHVLRFSEDGNTLFVGMSFSGGGNVYAVTGLNDVYDQAEADSLLQRVTVGAISGSTITGIAVDPNDADHIVVTAGGFASSARVRESNNATSANPTLVGIAGNLPNNNFFPVYGAVIDRLDPNLILIGTEYGVYGTDDGGTSWTDQNGTLGNVPVFDIRQQFRDYSEGVFNPGMVYLGTHGRGFHSSSTLLSAAPIKPFASTPYTADIQVYPNPVRDYTDLRFELEKASDVSVKIYDLNGRLVQNIQMGTMSAGSTSIQINATDLATGSYIIHFQTSEEVRTGKMIVRK